MVVNTTGMKEYTRQPLAYGRSFSTIVHYDLTITRRHSGTTNNSDVGRQDLSIVVSNTRLATLQIHHPDGSETALGRLDLAATADYVRCRFFDRDIPNVINEELRFWKPFFGIYNEEHSR